MIGDALEQACLAGAADAFGAGVVHRDAGIEQRIEDGLAGLDRDRAIAARELDVEAALHGRSFPRLEILHMYLPHQVVVQIF